MKEFIKELSIRWSDLDPNFHLRHTSYYDFGAQIRIDYLHAIGLTVEVMKKEGLGPILFREECIFRREIHLNDKININFKLKKARKDFSRFTIQHELKRQDGTLCAIITIDAAWIDTNARKLTLPPKSTIEAMMEAPKTDDFEFQE